jgi:N-acetyl-anhydromuramyl-L-alanine amidase AmpD
VCHCTGATDLNAIVRFYSAADGYQPHYVVDVLGTAHVFADETLIAYHAAMPSADAELYGKGLAVWQRFTLTGNEQRDGGVPYPGYAEWATRWHGVFAFESPLNLPTRDAPNALSIGIELQSRENTDHFTEAQYATLGELLDELLDRWQMPRERQVVLGHYDVAPLRRSTRRGGWDPGEGFDWPRVLTGLRIDS